MRGPNWIGGVFQKWVSYDLSPDCQGMPPAGYEAVSNVPCRTFGNVCWVTGLIAILLAAEQRGRPPGASREQKLSGLAGIVTCLIEERHRGAGRVKVAHPVEPRAVVHR